MKRCSKCKDWKDKEYFAKDKNRKDGLDCWCKKCKNEKIKEYRKNNKEKIKEQKKKYRENNKEKMINLYKEYRENNKEKIKEYQKEYRKNNKKKIKDYTKKYNKSSILFDSKVKYRKEIELYEEIAKSNNGNLMCKCTYCGEWFEPTKLQIKHRIGSINGDLGGESRLYCSQSCKQNCPIYYQGLYVKDQKPATSREVQPELRQMVFKRDNYTCQKCSIHKDNLNVGIHCHHKEGILWEPIQSADMDMCITLCEYCHKEVHGIDGCGYHEMRCLEQNFDIMKT